MRNRSTQLVRALSLVVLLSGVCLADKLVDSDWKTGTLTDVTSETGRRTVGDGIGRARQRDHAPRRRHVLRSRCR